MLRENEIVGIFDLDAATQTPATRGYLAQAQKRGAIREALDPGDLPRSFTVTRDGGVWLSSATANLLRYRSKAPASR